MKNQVIILCINHESSLGLVRCFGEAGVKPICVVYGAKEGLVFSSKYPSVKHYEESAEKCLEYIITNYSNITPKPFLFGSNDTAAGIINEHYDQLKNNFYLESANNKEGEVVRLMDKWKMYQMAEEYGLKVAKTILLDKGEEIPGNIEYPVFTKSLRTIDGGKSDEKICKTREELISFILQCHSKKIMIQTFIDKKFEFNYYGYSYDGVFIPYENHRPRPYDGALTGYHVFIPAVNNELYERVNAMMKATGYNGLFTVEFLVDKNDIYYFMEVNFRHDGDTYLLTPGINIPMEYCNRVLGTSSVQKGPLKKKIVGMRELVDYVQSVKTGKMSKIKWIWDFITADSHILWNFQDNRPFWNMVFKHFIRKKQQSDCVE